MIKRIFIAVVLLVPQVRGVAAEKDAMPAFFDGAKILFQGDSITDGNRGRNADPNHILGHGYQYIISAKFGAELAERHLTFINRGVSGNKVSDLAQHWQSDTLDLKPDILSILIGVNDLNGGVSAEQFEKQYDQLLTDTITALPHVRLVLCEPFGLPVGKKKDGWEKYHADLETRQAIVAKLAEKYRAPLVHFQKVFDDATRRAPAEYWIWDGVHPTYSGHQLLADEWIRTIQTYWASNSALEPTAKLENDFYDWDERHAQVLATQKTLDPEIVLIGDSITHMWGGPPMSNRQHGAKAWAETFGDHRVLNMGFGWDRTQNVLWRLDHGEMDGTHPKVVVLNIGTNNFSQTANARANTPAEVADAILAICDCVHAKSPQSRIIVMAVFPRGFAADDPYRAKIIELNKLLAQRLAGKPQIDFLDISDRFLTSVGKISSEIMSDGVHPTEAGYCIWGKALLAAGIFN